MHCGVIFPAVEIDVKTFWQAMGARPIGCAVVTARDSAGPAGFLALSATHLSADPPMLLVSIGMRTSALQTVQNSRHFAINYLARDDEALAQSFGGSGPLKGAERFIPERWTTLTTGAPVLNTAVGVLDCVLEETLERHNTVIAIGRLVDFRIHPDREPLVQFSGRFRGLA